MNVREGHSTTKGNYKTGLGLTGLLMERLMRRKRQAIVYLLNFDGLPSLVWARSGRANRERCETGAKQVHVPPHCGTTKTDISTKHWHLEKCVSF